MIELRRWLKMTRLTPQVTRLSEHKKQQNPDPKEAKLSKKLEPCSAKVSNP
jgi:hypothetical protein